MLGEQGSTKGVEDGKFREKKEKKWRENEIGKE